MTLRQEKKTKKKKLKHVLVSYISVVAIFQKVTAAYTNSTFNEINWVLYALQYKISIVFT